MPMRAVERAGGATRKLGPVTSRPSSGSDGGPARGNAREAGFSQLARLLARQDANDLDGIVAATLETLGTVLGSDRVELHLSSRLSTTRSPESTSTHRLSARGAWTPAEGFRALAAADGLDLDALPDRGRALRAGRPQQLSSGHASGHGSGHVSPNGSGDGDVAASASEPGGWRRLRSRLALPCVSAAGLLGVLVIEGPPSPGRSHGPPLAWLESAVEPFVIALDRHRIARELESLRAQRQHDARLECLGRVAGGVAHDFNNVLTAILGYSDLLELEIAEGGAGAVELAEIRAAADRAGELVEQMLSLGRPRAGDARVIDLSQWLKRLESMIARVLGDGIDLDIDLATPDCGQQDAALVRIDPLRLERALLNLASNARAALAERSGGARFAISTRRVSVDRHGRDRSAPGSARVAGLDAGDYVRLTARDNGCGMESSLIEQVFEPFFTTRESSGGTGLGLATTAELIRESHGGIRVESAPGEGAAFHLYFPLAAPSARRMADPAPRPDPRLASG